MSSLAFVLLISLQASGCVEAAPAWHNVSDVRREFSVRAIEVVRRASRVDHEGLARLVSPTAEFIMWRGDAGLGRQLAGVSGAVEFARYMDAARFAFVVPFAGPISTDACGIHTITVLFSDASGERGFTIDFRFDQGLLVEALGREGIFTEGELQSEGEADG